MTEPTIESLNEAAQALYGNWITAKNLGTYDCQQSLIAHARTLDAFDDYKREVSEEVRQYATVHGVLTDDDRTRLARFILPDPGDPLAEALERAAQVVMGMRDDRLDRVGKITSGGGKQYDVGRATGYAHAADAIRALDPAQIAKDAGNV